MAVMSKELLVTRVATMAAALALANAVGAAEGEAK